MTSTLRHREFQQRLLYAVGGQWFDFEGLIRDLYVAFLRPGDTALDVGMNVGGHTIQMAQAVGRHGKVIGVEPLPQLVQVVRDQLTIPGNATVLAQFRRFWRNLLVGDPWRQIEIHNVAVSDTVGRAKFFYAKDGSGLSGFKKRSVLDSYQVEQVEVEVTTLDRVLANVTQPVRFMKIDIEGAEYHAFKGATRIFTTDRPPIVFEFDRGAPSDFGYDCGDLFALLHGHTYEVYDFFGYRYHRAEELMNSLFWNYLALPREQTYLGRMVATVEDALKKQRITVPR